MVAATASTRRRVDGVGATSCRRRRDITLRRRGCGCERTSLIDSHAGDATFAAYCEHAGVRLLKEMRFWGDIYEMKKDALEAVDRCVEINQCVGCTR